MANPVRIYVLHHPESELAADLTRRIYTWFRMPTLEGIPVYLRSDPAPSSHIPADPQGGSLEYLIPLVDAHMVREPKWHDYLLRLASGCIPESQSSTQGQVMFPVALDNTAFNLPTAITHFNFVRYDSRAAKQNASSNNDLPTQHLLKDLTEALSRDLNARIFPENRGQRLKLFISYARSDGSEVPKAMRDYIQGQTQCEAFFDENDIGFGFQYANVLDNSLQAQSKALIVVVGDHYADRPVCRWEIRKFTQPVVLNRESMHARGQRLYLFHPVLVLNSMKGSSLTRVIPELGQVPTLRWQKGQELLAFSLLLRSVLLGARNVLAADRASEDFKSGIVLNRLPAPIALQQLVNGFSPLSRSRKSQLQIYYPGNGLPLMELQLLEETFANLEFTAFRDIDRHLPTQLKTAIQQRKRTFQGKIINISYGRSEKLASLGYLPEHMEEAVIYMLRPLLRLGADVMYGGNPPVEREWKGDQSRNMNLKLMNLLNDEQNLQGVNDVSVSKHQKAMLPSRQFNPVSWPLIDEVSPQDEAAWINSCTIIRVTPERAGLAGEVPDLHSPLGYAWRARALSCSRELMAQGFKCEVPGDADRHVTPLATIFAGGRLSGFSGCMPGIVEEFLYVVKYNRPTFILGGLGGATELIAKALLDSSSRIPPEFDMRFYAKDPKYASQAAALDQLQLPASQQTQARLNWLWDYLVDNRPKGLAFVCRNELSEDENRELLTTTDTMRAIHLVWQGLARMVE